MKFTDLPLDNSLLEAISYMGFETATPIQEQVIPEILLGKDVIACAQTGTGKTAAFVLPILHQLILSKNQHVSTLIVVPTRELAVQIDQQIQGFSYFTSINSIAIYGGGAGSDWDVQKEALQHGTNIIIATPGKLLAHLRMGYVNFSNVSHLILDEADRMLDMGFIVDIQSIISHLPEERQTLMFSATMAPNIRKLAKQILRKPIEITLEVSKPAEGVDQKVCMIKEAHKLPLLKQLLDERKEYDSILIFTSLKKKVNAISQSLKKIIEDTQWISSDLEQDKREEVLRLFAARQIKVLVATDVMSRGIDIKEINLVVNYDAPADAEDYVHRVGRTARASTNGEAITLISEKDLYRLRRIEDLIGYAIPVLPIPDGLESPVFEEKTYAKKRRVFPKRNTKKRWQNKKKDKPE